MYLNVESLYSIPETNIILQVNYTSIKNKKLGSQLLKLADLRVFPAVVVFTTYFLKVFFGYRIKQFYFISFPFRAITFGHTKENVFPKELMKEFYVLSNEKDH